MSSEIPPHLDPLLWRAIGTNAWMPIMALPVVLCIKKPLRRNKKFEWVPPTFTLVNKDTGDVIIAEDEWCRVAPAASEWLRRALPQ